MLPFAVRDQVTLLETTLKEMKPDMGAIEQWMEKDRQYKSRLQVRICLCTTQLWPTSHTLTTAP